MAINVGEHFPSLDILKRHIQERVILKFFVSLANSERKRVCA